MESPKLIGCNDEGCWMIRACDGYGAPMWETKKKWTFIKQQCSIKAGICAN